MTINSATCRYMLDLLASQYMNIISTKFPMVGHCLRSAPTRVMATPSLCWGIWLIYALTHLRKTISAVFSTTLTPLLQVSVYYFRFWYVIFASLDILPVVFTYYTYWHAFFKLVSLQGLRERLWSRISFTFRYCNSVHLPLRYQTTNRKIHTTDGGRIMHWCNCNDWARSRKV